MLNVPWYIEIWSLGEINKEINKVYSSKKNSEKRLLVMIIENIEFEENI